MELGKSVLSRAAGITVYGYGAPVTDVEAVELMKSASHLSQMKDIAPFTIINLAKNEDEQRKKWSEFYDVKCFCIVINLKKRCCGEILE